MKSFVNGRKSVFNDLKKQLEPSDLVIWLHAASLGEYEQGVPVLEGLKKKYPQYKILVTFFSPSGYEVKKNNKLADVTTYLPLDTRKNAERFLEMAKPNLAIFVKYEVWPNFMEGLKQRNIPTILISGNFRQDQIYFRPGGDFMKAALQKFDHLFVQTQAAKQILENHEFTNVSISGDTRFDRVSQQLEMDNHLDFVENFKQNQLCLVAGSTWPEDEERLVDFINSAKNLKYIIAPHQIKASNIEQFRKQLKKPTVLFSEKEGKNLSECDILIIDTVGLLTKIYAYADLAYVGGAAGNTGLHNILEPAAFGLPIVIGQNHSKFPEAKLLQEAGGLFVAHDKKECFTILNQLVNNDSIREEAGQNSAEFIRSNRGATPLILNYIDEQKLLTPTYFSDPKEGFL